MAWDFDRASERIGRLIEERQSILVEDVAERLRVLSESRSGTLSARDALVSIPRNRAVLVDGVHLYARLSNYDEYRLEHGRETGDSHKRALSFLHLLYAAMDRVLQDLGAQRVDHHGARVHGVIVDPNDNEASRVLKGIAVAQALQGLVRLANSEFADSDFEPQIKIGIDSGKCVAINDGKGCEQEPLFLGNAANYAAKLADGAGEGIYLSNRVRAIVGLAGLPRGLVDERASPLEYRDFLEFRTRAQMSGFDVPQDLAGDEDQTRRLLNEWRGEIDESVAKNGGRDAFNFHFHKPPLRTIEYDKLAPSNSIRMPLASIFADLDGYTAYIEEHMANGRVGEAVRALHVLRGEFHNVLRSDFESRKVRYIGDCMHGLLACGTGSDVDLAWTTREAIKCAAALQGSFEIVQSRLPGLQSLGLATGVEIGVTPISRIGIRGDRSVRVASSTATIQSQVEQEKISGSGLSLGPNALSQLSLSARRYFVDGTRMNPDYDDLTAILAGAAMLAGAHSASATGPDEFRPHCNS